MDYKFNVQNKPDHSRTLQVDSFKLLLIDIQLQVELLTSTTDNFHFTSITSGTASGQILKLVNLTEWTFYLILWQCTVKVATWRRRIIKSVRNSKSNSPLPHCGCGVRYVLVVLVCHWLQVRWNNEEVLHTGWQNCY